MAGGYEAVEPPRFTIEHGDGERIRVPARRHGASIVALSIWLVAWTAIGAGAIAGVIGDGDLFLLAWLVAWALGWSMIASIVAWQLKGSETLCARGGDLEIGWQIGRFGRRRLYRGAEIRGLAAGGASELAARMQAITPPFLGANAGSISFTYGARTIRAAAGLDEVEARRIVDHLRMRLPGNATL